MTRWLAPPTSTTQGLFTSFSEAFDSLSQSPYHQIGEIWAEKFKNKMDGKISALLGSDLWSVIQSLAASQ